MPNPTAHLDTDTDIDVDIDVDVDGLPISTRAPGEPLPGDTLAWERLGVGHRCETWLAWSRRLWTPAVVKLPRPHQAEHPRARLTLQRESAALAGNPHPGLPRLLADGSGATLPFVVVEYLDGATLESEIDDGGRYTPADVAALGAQLLSALMTLHARGLAHLDVKPENVVLCQGRPTLIDFGSARRLGALQPASNPIGTAGYAAPELEAGAPIDARMDLYGLGTVLHEMLCGQPTFPSDVDAERRPPVPPMPDSALNTLVLALLDPEPDRRPDTTSVLRLLGRVASASGQEVWPAWADDAL